MPEEKKPHWKNRLKLSLDKALEDGNYLAVETCVENLMKEARACCKHSACCTNKAEDEKV